MANRSCFLLLWFYFSRVLSRPLQSTYLSFGYQGPLRRFSEFQETILHATKAAPSEVRLSRNCHPKGTCEEQNLLHHNLRTELINLLPIDTTTL